MASAEPARKVMVPCHYESVVHKMSIVDFFGKPSELIIQSPVLEGPKGSKWRIEVGLKHFQIWGHFKFWFYYFAGSDGRVQLMGGGVLLEEIRYN